jgi:hypothetical protein
MQYRSRTMILSRTLIAPCVLLTSFSPRRPPWSGWEASSKQRRIMCGPTPMGKRTQLWCSECSMGVTMRRLLRQDLGSPTPYRPSSLTLSSHSLDDILLKISIRRYDIHLLALPIVNFIS